MESLGKDLANEFQSLKVERKDSKGSIKPGKVRAAIQAMQSNDPGLPPRKPVFKEPISSGASIPCAITPSTSGFLTSAKFLGHRRTGSAPGAGAINKKPPPPPPPIPPKTPATKNNSNGMPDVVMNTIPVEKESVTLEEQLR